MRVFLATAAAFLAIAPGMAQAAEPPCITSGEFSSLASFALPSALGGATKRCSTVLGPSSYMRSSGAQLIERYAVGKQQAWPEARAAFIKLSSSSDDRASNILKDLPDKNLQDMLNLMLEGMVSQEIPPEKCDTIDQFVRLLAPLPPENMAELIGLTVGLVGNNKSGDGMASKINICQN